MGVEKIQQEWYSHLYVKWVESLTKILGLMVDFETSWSIDSDIHYNFIGSYWKYNYYAFILYSWFSSNMYNYSLLFNFICWPPTQNCNILVTQDYSLVRGTKG